MLDRLRITFSPSPTGINKQKVLVGAVTSAESWEGICKEVFGGAASGIRVSEPKPITTPGADKPTVLAGKVFHGSDDVGQVRMLMPERGDPVNAWNNVFGLKS